MKVSLYILVTVLLISFSLPAAAMRCGRNLISIGDRAAEVRHFCGDPTDITSREQEIRYGVKDRYTGAFIEKVRIEVVEEWTYNLGPNRLMRVLLFRDGRVVDIESLNYGF